MTSCTFNTRRVVNAGQLPAYPYDLYSAPWR